MYFPSEKPSRNLQILHKRRIDGLMQDCSISISNGVEIPQSYSEQSIASLWDLGKIYAGEPLRNAIIYPLICSCTELIEAQW